MLRSMVLFIAILASPPSDNALPPSTAAQAYFDQALLLIKEHHRNTDKIDWPRIRIQANVLMAAANEPSDTYPAIRFILRSLDEQHSVLLEPKDIPGKVSDQPSRGYAKIPASISMPSFRIIRNRYGYLALPKLNSLGSDGALVAARYSDTSRRALLTMDKTNLCGFIIDLRNNSGGNMWPMLLGLDPLLGTPPFGYFVRANKAKQAWTRASGNIFPSSDPITPSAPSFKLKHSLAPIAVLVGPQTISSGEMTAIALIGRPYTQVFGKPSAGFTTANNVYPLSDGAVLLITEAAVQDRTGRSYVGPIVPDQKFEAFEAERGAQRWLEEKCDRPREK